MSSADRWAQMAANPELDPAMAIELPETGWGALIAWIAGPSWVHPDRSRQIPLVRQTLESGGSTVTTTSDRTTQDQSAIDDDIAGYLRDAGVPAPPATARWSLRRPGDLTTEDFWAQLNSSMDRHCPRARHPLEIHRCAAVVLVELLSSGPGASP